MKTRSKVEEVEEEEVEKVERRLFEEEDLRRSTVEYMLWRDVTWRAAERAKHQQKIALFVRAFCSGNICPHAVASNPSPIFDMSPTYQAPYDPPRATKASRSPEKMTLLKKQAKSEVVIRYAADALMRHHYASPISNCTWPHTPSPEQKAWNAEQKELLLDIQIAADDLLRNGQRDLMADMEANIVANSEAKLSFRHDQVDKAASAVRQPGGWHTSFVMSKDFKRNKLDAIRSRVREDDLAATCPCCRGSRSTSQLTPRQEIINPVGKYPCKGHCTAGHWCNSRTASNTHMALFHGGSEQNGLFYAKADTNPHKILSAGVSSGSDYILSADVSSDVSSCSSSAGSGIAADVSDVSSCSCSAGSSIAPFSSLLPDQKSRKKPRKEASSSSAVASDETCGSSSMVAVKRSRRLALQEGAKEAL